jgi:hypothetical protein
VEEVFVDVAELVARVVRPTLQLVPDHVVPQHPALLVAERDRQPPGDAAKVLAVIGVADVEPERADRRQHAAHLGEDC